MDTSREMVLLAGGSGSIGRHWVRLYGSTYREVRCLSRSPGTLSGIRTFGWDPANGRVDPAAFDGVTRIINLAGAGIADGWWTDARKAEIIRSRTESLATLRKGLRESGCRPGLVLSASAIGIYGDHEYDWVDETSPPGTGFLAEACTQWEQAAAQLGSDGHPLALLRIGIVIGRQGGALARLRLPLKAGISVSFGRGRTWMSWIHESDLAGMMSWLLAGQRTGIWNAVAPSPVTTKQMAVALKDVYHGRLVLPVPAKALRLGLGELADTVLTGARVRVDKALEAGFRFRFPDLVPALADLRANP